MSIGLHGTEEEGEEDNVNADVQKELISYLRCMRDKPFADLTQGKIKAEAPTRAVADALVHVFGWDELRDTTDDDEVRKLEIEWALIESLGWTRKLEQGAVIHEDELKYLLRRQRDLASQQSVLRDAIRKAQKNVDAVYREAVYRKALTGKTYTKEEHYG